MSSPIKASDPAFQGAGHKIGLEIWRIENFKPVPVPKADFGKFYSGDSYIVLQTSVGKGGAYQYDIHFWIGKDSTQDESGTAAIKTVELDFVLGGSGVQHREFQGHESDKFLSYFKPCILPLEGGFASGFHKSEDEKFETRLYICRGKRIARVKQVPFSRSSLNHDDVFILDTEKKLFQFNGASSNIQERAKALEVVQHLKDTYHNGTCEVAVIEDGKLVAESDSGEFWLYFGGFAPIGKRVIGEDEVVPETTAPKLYSIVGGKILPEEKPMSKAVLDNSKIFLLDCGSEVYVWVGRSTQLDERKAACTAAEDFAMTQRRPKATRIIQLTQNNETNAFKSYFESWPVGQSSGNSGGEKGRGKVAALLKQQGVEVKGAAKSSSVVDEVPPLLEGNGRLEVWCINGSTKTPLSKEDLGKFYSGDCYIVLYSYQSSDKKEEFFLTSWFGKDSVVDDQVTAIKLANNMWQSLKGRAVQGRIIQGREPAQFTSLFQPYVVLKGGLSSGYKKILVEKSAHDDTYASDVTALIRVAGNSIHNFNALQVDAVATSLSTTECFVLQSGGHIFVWFGNSSSPELQQWAEKVAEFLKPGVSVKHCKEGTETSAFLLPLHGKQPSSNSKVVVQDPVIREPHLYTFSIKNGKLEISEVFNFTQDDLLTEDMLVLDTRAEVFIWMGQSVESKEKMAAFDFGQKYIELAVSLHGLSPDVPLYKVSEGHEPSFFKSYFIWDNTKSMAPGNSFEKKLSLLFGIHTAESKSSSAGGEHTQRASALAALTTAFNSSSQEKTPSERPRTSNDGTPTQRASALAALNSAFNQTPERPKTTSTAVEAPKQRALALAALNSAFNQTPERPKTTSTAVEAPTQRASALAALNSAFSQPAKPKATASPPARIGQGSQRAAAIAALSTVLTAEQKTGQESSPLSKQSPRADFATSGSVDVEAKVEEEDSGHPAVSSEKESLAAATTDDVTAESTTADIPEAIAHDGTAEAEPVTVEPTGDNATTESNTVDATAKSSADDVPAADSATNGASREGTSSEVVAPEPPVKEQIVEQKVEKPARAVAQETAQAPVKNEGPATYSYERLKAKSSNPVIGIDHKHKEKYLSDEEFATVFGMTKEEFSQSNEWQQMALKRKFGLA